MKNRPTFRAVYAALFAALVFVGTQFIRIPLPFGYFNLGDCFILLSAILIGGPYAVIASAAGAVMADVLSGYVVYAPATLLIKSLMVVIMIIASTLCKDRHKDIEIVILAVGAVFSELIMVIGYFVYDTMIYGFAGALAALSGNTLQGVVAVVTSTLIISIFKHNHLFKHIKL